jgi:hypothetical protein
MRVPADDLEREVFNRLQALLRNHRMYERAALAAIAEVVETDRASKPSSRASKASSARP